jgi:two-component system chemotaxis response regulator CheB
MKIDALGHDIITIGTSAGGVDALRELVPMLRRDLPASIFVVLHIGVRSHLAGILARDSQLPVVEAEHGMTVERGTVYVAAPGRHLMLHDHHILLSKGPRENMARPAIDPLFRSAAATFGGRVIGVVLTGALNDGTSGLWAIKRCGGIAVVQDPRDAAISAMPRNALRNVDVDHVATLREMAPLLDRLAREPAGKTPEIPWDIRLETAIAAQDISNMKIEEGLGELSPFTCPECHGALWEITDGSMLRYRCHIGHAYTAEAALSAGDAEIDQMLEQLLRSHRERAALARRMANEERGHQRHELADRLDERATEYEQNAALVLRLSRHRDLPEVDGSDAAEDLIDNEDAIEGTAAEE